MDTSSISESSGLNYNAVYDDGTNSTVNVEDFLNLMVMQLANQDFMNPVDDSEYLSQLATFATMQQMQELAEYSKYNYTMSLVGKEVTVAKYDIGGNVQWDSGPVEKITFFDDEHLVYVNGNSYNLNQIMEIHQGTSSATDLPLDASSLSLFTGTVTSGTASFEWKAPESDVTAQNELTYTVYYSVNEAMDTVNDVKNNGTVFGEADRTNLNQEVIIGLSPSTTYYVSVLVKDTQGNESVYKKSTITTDAI